MKTKSVALRQRFFSLDYKIACIHTANTGKEKRKNKNPRGQMPTGDLELVIRVELMTSSLPRMCSTN